MGHVQRHETAATLAHPGKCHDCGYSGLDRDFYIDTGICTEWDGQIIICSACLLNIMVKSYGYNPFTAMESYIVETNAIASQTEGQVKLLGQLRDGLATLGLTPTSIVNLVAVMKEEKDGRDEDSRDSGNDPEELGSVEPGIQPTGSIEQLDGKPNSSDNETGGDDSPVDDFSLFKLGLGFS